MVVAKRTNDQYCANLIVVTKRANDQYCVNLLAIVAERAND